MNIIFLGLPGSGKSTQGQLLSEKLGIPWISIGLLLREEFRKGTPDGIEANKYLSSGLNCPTEIKIRILEKILGAATKGFILDNYPRTKDDLSHLKKWIRNTGRKIDKAFLLKTTEEEVISRLLQKEQNDLAGEKRNDASLENIKTRIRKGFKEDVDLILNYFKKMNNFVEINGGKSVEEVHEEIMSKLGK